MQLTFVNRVLVSIHNIYKFYSRLRKIQTVKLAACKEWMKKGYLEKFWNGVPLEEEEEEEEE